MANSPNPLTTVSTGTTDYYESGEVAVENLKIRNLTPSFHKPRRFNTFYYTPYPGTEGIYFTKLLKECEADGVQVILVFLPDYIGTYESNFQGEAFKRDIQRLAGGYKNVFIYDYNDPEVFPLRNSGYFLDGGYGKTNSHLSREGARKFNRMLVKDLKKHYRYLVRAAQN